MARTFLCLEIMAAKQREGKEKRGSVNAFAFLQCGLPHDLKVFSSRDQMFTPNQANERPWNKKNKLRPRQDSNLQSSDPESDALSIRPRGHSAVALANERPWNKKNKLRPRTCNLLLPNQTPYPLGHADTEQ
ncbi:hypothetical protein V5799_017584 [Amblyomma americanum]|uniref:Uncharacterized protein n=1 Tax=Amblyomma americanum TaxID=6943 RepID=A0AAQ4F2Z0_AMBAM